MGQHTVILSILDRAAANPAQHPSSLHSLFLRPPRCLSSPPPGCSAAAPPQTRCSSAGPASPQASLGMQTQAHISERLERLRSISNSMAPRFYCCMSPKKIVKYFQKGGKCWIQSIMVNKVTKNCIISLWLLGGDNRHMEQITARCHLGVEGEALGGHGWYRS